MRELDEVFTGWVICMMNETEDEEMKEQWWEILKDLLSDNWELEVL